MLKKFFNGGISVLLVSIFLVSIVSCEEDFTNIGTDVITNTKFGTNDTIIEITTTSRDVANVRADALQTGGILGQYLLGVSKTSNYKKIEASIVTQLNIDNSLKLVDKVYGADTTVVTTVDTAFVKLPYQVVVDQNGDVELDSVFGDKTKTIKLNIYQINRYLNQLNPADPTQRNRYDSDDDYDKIAGELNATLNYEFLASKNDTIVEIKQRYSDGTLDSIIKFTLPNSNPFAAIPLDEAKIKQIFLDEIDGQNFSTQDMFNNYFRGMMLEAFGDDNVILSLALSNAAPDLIPSVEIFYTNTIFVNGVADSTISRQVSMPFGGIRTSVYKPTANNTSNTNNFPLQGTAGTEVVLDIFGPDTDNNGIPDSVEELRAQQWLVNDASLILSVDNATITNGFEGLPLRLFVYKEKIENGTVKASQIKDVFTEGTSVFGGFLDLTDQDDPDFYEFKITDYISDILSGEDNYFTNFVVKVASPTDYPRETDTIVPNYNWNPKGVTILNENQVNGDRRIKLKISYSKKN